mmetsp:Transcript_27179/g.66104  ORF Transcript_27179/g.66104 Transcript_27179/m.66104 type:complete len:107 (-) Transcript_27179:1048-1368(-)
MNLILEELACEDNGGASTKNKLILRQIMALSERMVQGFIHPLVDEPEQYWYGNLRMQNAFPECKRYESFLNESINFPRLFPSSIRTDCNNDSFCAATKELSEVDLV